VSVDFKSVYLVLGMGNSIAEATGTRLGTLIGISASLTLLPWHGRIVYDGLMLCSGQRTSQVVLKKLVGKYATAMDKGNIIRSLPMVEPEKLTGGLALSAADLHDLKVQHSVELSALRAAPSMTPSSWVFRRHGYSRCIYQLPG